MYPQSALAIQEIFLKRLLFIEATSYDRRMTASPVRTGAERERLITEYLPFVDRVAGRFARCGERREDLVQVGALALVRAIDRRDPARSDALPSYVNRCVEGAIRNHLRDRSAPVRVPRDHGGLDATSVATARRPLPLLEDDTPGSDEALDELMLARALVARAAHALDAEQRRIVLLRFFLDRTQEQVAGELGLSQAHVSRSLDAALVRMRERLERDEPLCQG